VIGASRARRDLTPRDLEIAATNAAPPIPRERRVL
jgi:hypothetical protein